VVLAPENKRTQCSRVFHLKQYKETIRSSSWPWYRSQHRSNTFQNSNHSWIKH